MAKRNLTEKLVAQLVPGKKRYQVYDAKTHGFGVRIDPNGRTSFLWYAKVGGAPRFRALGDFPQTTVAEARSAADEWNAVASAWKRAGFAGDNPFQKAAKVEPAKRAEVPTFGELLEAYIDGHLRRDDKKPFQSEAARILRAEKIERSAHNAKWMPKKYFPTWLARPIDEIVIGDVLAIKHAHAKKIYTANRCIEFVKAVYNWAGAKPDGKVNFWACANPAKDVVLYDGEQEREAYLKPAELVRFSAALDDEPSQDLRDFLILKLNTGARRSNVEAMRWDSIDLDTGVWQVPYSKNGDGYPVKLLPAALAVVKRRHAEALEHAVYVFPGAGRTGHAINFHDRWDAFRKRAGLEHIRLHDLRRTTGSYIYAACRDLKATGAALGHRNMQSTLIYARLLPQATNDARTSGQERMVLEMKKAKKRQKALTSGRKALSA